MPTSLSDILDGIIDVILFVYIFLFINFKSIYIFHFYLFTGGAFK